MKQSNLISTAPVSRTSAGIGLLERVQTSRELGPLEPHVERSWVRCLTEYGIDPEVRPESAVYEISALRERQQRLGAVLGIAKAEMENLYEQIAGSGYAVILTDAEATVLHSISDPSLKRDFRAVGMLTGAWWGEQYQGTNGIGTCIAERAPVTVHRGEHYLSTHLQLSCSGAPIFDAHGDVLGVLDASTANARDTKLIQRHTMALVNMSAALIARSHFINEFSSAWVLGFHSRPEFTGLLHEALIALDGDGTVLAVNEAALEQLSKADRATLVGRNIADVMQVDFDTIEQRAVADGGTLWPIRCACHGRRFFALVRAPRQPVKGSDSRRATVADDDTARTTRTATAANADRISDAHADGDADIDFDDPTPESREHVGSDARMRHNLASARKLFPHHVSILLCGATGTGKEEFAKAVHRQSPWAGRPFVAVNCAAIPEPLIESELFGYSRGAFTDASKEGRRGKILQASGGTLFLDEIGDMPLPLQTRLLRVLEEQSVTPLGSEKEVPLDLHVISASHRDLNQMVANGEFREDLFYRLNGIVLHLPLLRERSDKAELIRTLLHEERGDRPVRISEDAQHKLLTYGWPGNLRQMRNVLRTAAALCRDDVIRMSNLPQEIVDASAQPCLVPTDAVAHDDMPGRAALDNAERLALQQQLDLYRWNISKTADALGISRNTLYRKLRKHGLAGCG